MLTIKEMVQNNKQVHFEFYQNGELNYKTEDGFEFPVPIADTGDAKFLAQDKAMLFMRYIRKQMDRNPNSRSQVVEVIAGEQAIFVFYRKDELWYETANGFEFPVPVAKVAANIKLTAKVDQELLTSYIDAQRKLIEDAQKEQEG